MKTTSTEVTTDIVVYRLPNSVPELLLIKRKNPPFEGKWALPGGFVETSEEVIDAALRELKEETNVSLHQENLRFIDYFDAPDRDPRARIISFAFSAQVPPDTNHTASDDAEEAQWFPLNDLPPLAFDHQTIVARCFEV